MNNYSFFSMSYMFIKLDFSVLLLTVSSGFIVKKFFFLFYVYYVVRLLSHAGKLCNVIGKCNTFKL